MRPLKHKRHFIFSVVLILLAFSSFAEQATTAFNFVNKYINQPKLVGSGTFKVMFWELYEASLYAEDGSYNQNSNFALDLKYSRRLSGEKIAEKSIELIEAQGVEDSEKLAQWQSVLLTLIPDVEKNDSLTGIQAEDGAHFYLNGEKIGHIEDRELCTYFFGIWLSQDTSAPDLRAKLLATSD